MQTLDRVPLTCSESPYDASRDSVRLTRLRSTLACDQFGSTGSDRASSLSSNRRTCVSKRCRPSHHRRLVHRWPMCSRCRTLSLAAATNVSRLSARGTATSLAHCSRGGMRATWPRSTRTLPGGATRSICSPPMVGSTRSRPPAGAVIATVLARRSATCCMAACRHSPRRPRHPHRPPVGRRRRPFSCRHLVLPHKRERSCRHHHLSRRRDSRHSCARRHHRRPHKRHHPACGVLQACRVP